jgi:hypothetical protein
MQNVAKTYLIGFLLFVVDDPEQSRTLIDDFQQSSQQAGVGEHEPDRRLMQRMLESFRSKSSVGGSKRVSHPRQTVAPDLPVHSGFGINSDSFFTILIAPSVSSESKVTHTRGCSLDALVQLVVGVGYGFRQGKAVTNG